MERDSSSMLPVAGVRHARPRLRRSKRFALLKQFDRNVVGRPDERHVTVARRAIDLDSFFHQLCACGVDVVDFIRQMPEVPTVRWQAIISVPIIGQFDRTFRLIRRSKEDERETAFFAVHTPSLFKSQHIVECDRLFEIENSDHRVQVFDSHLLILSGSGEAQRAGIATGPVRKLRHDHLISPSCPIYVSGIAL